MPRFLRDAVAPVVVVLDDRGGVASFLLGDETTMIAPLAGKAVGIARRKQASRARWRFEAVKALGLRSRCVLLGRAAARAGCSTGPSKKNFDPFQGRSKIVANGWRFHIPIKYRNCNFCSVS